MKELIDTVYNSYIEGWPMLCVHCGSTDLTYSIKHDDVYCEECGMWQVKEDNDE